MSRVRHIPGWQNARTTFALAGVAVLALVALVNSAEAGCGDYVFIRNASGHLVRASTLLKDHAAHSGCSGPNCPGDNSPAATTDSVPAPREENLPSKLPCHGPNCSSRSELPASPAPLPSPPRSVQESTALLVKLNDGDRAPAAQFGWLAAELAQELHYPRPIFHPPR